MSDTPPGATKVHTFKNGKHADADLYRLAAFVLAVTYGVVLSQIPSEQFKDFSNYLVYAEHSWSRLSWLMDKNVLSAFSNEPVWLLINAGLGAFLPPEAVVRLIIFVPATLVAWLVLLSNPRQFVWLLAFLLLPLVIKNHLIHLRQGVAIAIFLLGWFSHHRIVRWALMGVTPFVHASFFFVLLILCAARAMTHFHLSAGIRILSFVMMGALVSGGLAWVTAMLGARQAQEYEFAMADVSGLGFLFWLGILGLLILEGQTYLRKHAFEIGMIAFYLSTYWFIEVTARIFESGMLPVLLAGLALTGWRRHAFLMAIVFVQGGTVWLMRIGQPAMGFGII